MGKNQQVLAYFLSFCIERHRNVFPLYGCEARGMEGRYGVPDCPAMLYVLPHYQSRGRLTGGFDVSIALCRKGGNMNLVERYLFQRPLGPASLYQFFLASK